MLLAFIYWSTAGYTTRQMEAVIEAEVQGLAEHYRVGGLPALRRLLLRRVRSNPASASIYLLADPQFRLLAGNLDSWPAAARAPRDGWIEFGLRIEDEEPRPKVHRARARLFTLRGGFHLLVGRNWRDLDEMRSAILRAVAWCVAVTLALAVMVAWWMRGRVARRIEAIDRTARRIMQGKLEERIESDGSGDEFDELVAGLNAMLARIEGSMEDVRRVSDNVAHDLRTPLGRLRTRLVQLRTKALDEDSKALAEAALDEADQMLATFNALLRIARIEAGDRRHAFAPVDLAAIGNDVAELYAPLAESCSIDFRFSSAPAPVHGDADLLFQSLANLLDNAMKYTPRGGRVCLRITAEEESVDVIVSDSGPGVPIDEREAVLRRFYRVESARSTPGSGLGLCLVAAVVQLHEAELELSDNDPGLRVRIRFRRSS
ncbi:MAG: HAMP domain-containing histidine kinase [Ectothiorhodospiraceae bacterium AqS1]|nr:HAMP domain-containing histidine kinase [Ectothiorhodospiraceae bacterium AqS1]MBF2761664.1 HAMP domain-containing histidine kinase [Ectothiorhodospiraceae bacterium AqS1]